MAFIVDRKNFRTNDPERGYELFRIGGGSDGTFRFRIVGPEGDCSFSAHYVGENLRASEIERLGPTYDIEPIVWSVHYWPKEWKPIIQEAMTAYVINHGSPIPGLRAFVRFSSNENVLDA